MASLRRSLATIASVVLLAVGVFVAVRVIDGNREAIDRVCELGRRQNDVLLRYGAILTTPIAIPPGSSPALAEAIAARNQQFAEAAEFTRTQVRDFSCGDR